jgi:alpha-L-fucosidase
MKFRFGDGRDWFFEKRFGLFLHWGLYAVGGWHEQDQYSRNISRREYAKQMQVFNPVQFDPEAWLDMAQAAGMEYLTFTTKHIDGFCMWNTAQTDYNIMHTLYGKDILGMLAEACHRRNFPLCLYHAIVDMHHPNYPSAGRPYEVRQPEPTDQPDLTQYLAYVKAQVTELCTNYGKLHGFWWDGNVLEYKDSTFNALIRKLQPDAVINNRGMDAGDFSTPERDWDDDVNRLAAFERPSEACQSIGTQSWGYRRNEDYYSDEHLIRSLDKVMAKGGNYLLNVGPTELGTFPHEAQRILQTIGGWYENVKEAFDGTEPASELVDNPEVLLTRRDKTLYVHLTKTPVSEGLILAPLNKMPKRATLLNTGAAVEARVEIIPAYANAEKPCLRLRKLPVNKLTGTVLVVKLEFDQL